MASNEELRQNQQFEIELDLSNVPAENRRLVKEEVGNFVTNEIQRQVSTGTSPVKGEGRFQRLDKEYAKNEKQGNTTPNLQLEGDLMSSLGHRNSADGVIVGIMRASQRGKADGHNNFFGLSKLPRRRFIPGTGQDFKRNITSGIKRIVREFERTTTETTVNDTTITQRTATEAQTSVTLDTVRGSTLDRILRGNNGN